VFEDECALILFIIFIIYRLRIYAVVGNFPSFFFSHVEIFG